MEIKINKRTIGILGAKGSGKTYFMREFIESIDRNCVIFDNLGIVKPKDAKSYIIDKENLAEQAVILAQIIENTSKNININLSLLTTDELIEFCNMLLSTCKLKDKYIFFDEIQDLMNERYKRSKEVERLIRNGRNYGNTFIYNTQRPATISKTVFNLTDLLIVFRLNYKHDIEVIEEILGGKGMKKAEITEIVNTITNQQIGEKIYIILGEVG
jgi:hypothetical protein